MKYVYVVFEALGTNWGDVVINGVYTRKKAAEQREREILEDWWKEENKDKRMPTVDKTRAFFRKKLRMFVWIQKVAVKDD